jgi:aspartyl protease family protein
MAAMSGGEIALLIGGLVMIGFVGTELFGQRERLPRLVLMALGWVGVFALVYSLVLFRPELEEVWYRARADLGGAPVVQVSGSETVLRMSRDGHFWVDATVGDRQARFLIDSGATTTALSLDGAERLGVSIDRSGRPLVVMTASGPQDAWPARIERITLGNIVIDDLPVLVSDMPDDVNLLGMNWLSRLERWQVDGQEMRLVP